MLIFIRHFCTQKVFRRLSIERIEISISEKSESDSDRFEHEKLKGKWDFPNIGFLVPPPFIFVPLSPSLAPHPSLFQSQRQAPGIVTEKLGVLGDEELGLVLEEPRVANEQRVVADAYEMGWLWRSRGLLRKSRGGAASEPGVFTEEPGIARGTGGCQWNRGSLMRWVCCRGARGY